MPKHPSSKSSKAGGSGVFQRVYALVALIPPGRVMSYGQISALLENACSARYVGFAVSAAPAGLPCHRVVDRLGRLAPGDIFGGADNQRRMLEEEGAVFLPDGRVDMTQCRFVPKRDDFASGGWEKV